MPVRTQHNDNIVLGNGELFFDLFDENGDTTGERYLGETPGFTLSVTSETLDKYSSDGQVAELLASVTTRVERTGTLICDDISNENLALFFAGKAETKAQSMATGAEDTFMARSDRTYQLGDGFGVMDVSSVVVTQTAGSNVLTIDTDYTVDLEMGRVTILDNTITSTPEEIKVTYDVAAKDIETMVTTDEVSLKGVLHFISFNAHGKKKHVFMPNVELSPDGDMSFQSREDYQQITLSLKVQKPDTGEAIQIYEQ